MENKKNMLVYLGWHHMNYVHKCKCSTEVSYIMQSTKYNNKQAALARWTTASVTFDPSQIAHTPHCTRNQPDLDSYDSDGDNGKGHGKLEWEVTKT